MTISAKTVMELRNATGAGMMDCKRALEETGGDLELAKDSLRKKGIAIAAKKSGRETLEGGIGLAISEDGLAGAMVHLACETDFVSRNSQFRELLDKLTAQVLEQGEEKLPEQKLPGGKTVGELITEAVAALGENLNLVGACRLTLAGGGLLGGYVHSNNRIGVLVQLRAQKRGDPLTALARDLAMHVAASQVAAVSAQGIDPAVIEKEREIYSAQAEDSGKPAEIVAKMVEGRLKKFVREVSLVDQPFVKDQGKSVQAVVAESAAALGTEIEIERFLKFQF